MVAAVVAESRRVGRGPVEVAVGVELHRVCVGVVGAVVELHRVGLVAVVAVVGLRWVGQGAAAVVGQPLVHPEPVGVAAGVKRRRVGLSVRRRVGLEAEVAQRHRPYPPHQSYRPHRRPPAQPSRSRRVPGAGLR